MCEEKRVVSIGLVAYFNPVTICFPIASRMEPSLTRAVLSLAVRRPWRIPAILGMAWSFRARGWYRRPPFLPLPPKDYIRWRMETAYGDAGTVPPGHELEGFVIWSARMRRWMRG